MKPQINSKYKLVVNINGTILTFRCIVDSIDDTFISFTDIYGKKFNYNKNVIVSFEEIEDEHF